MRLPSILLVLLSSSVQTVGAQPQETTVPTAPFGVFDWIVLVLYLLVLVGMGYYFSRRGTSTDDFFLAGGRIPGWAAGLSIYGTSLSALTFMATPAKVYATNWVYILINVCELLVAPIIIFYYLPFFRRLQVTSAYEYLGKRFNVATRWFGSLFFLFFQLGRMGIVVALPSIALATVTGVNVYLCILIIGLLATLYTALGGIEAVVWTDVLQVFVLLGGALFSIGIILVEVGGVSEFMSVARANDKFHMFNWTWDYTTTAVWVVLFGNLFAKLVPFTADQTIVQRYMTTDSEEEAARSIWTAALLAVPGAVIFFSIGTALFVFYETYPGLLASSLETDAIFPFFIAQQLPAGIAGLVIAGLFAASMSSRVVLMVSVGRMLRPDRAVGRLRRVLEGLVARQEDVAERELRDEVQHHEAGGLDDDAGDAEPVRAGQPPDGVAEPRGRDEVPERAEGRPQFGRQRLGARRQRAEQIVQQSEQERRRDHPPHERLPGGRVNAGRRRERREHPRRDHHAVEAD